MIVIDELYGKSYHSGKVGLFADTQAEVPPTGVETTIPAYKNKLEQGCTCHTGDGRIGFLDNYDHWRWTGDYEEFTVVRSGSNVSEKIQITPYIEKNGYDLTAHRKKGTYYGGYALQSGVTPASAPYDGGNWTWSTMETADGTHLKPVPNTTYYVCEFPAGYMRLYLHGGFSGNTWKSFIPVTAIPHNHVDNGGFLFSGEEVECSGASKTLDITVGGRTVTITVESCFSENFHYGITEGYLMWLQSTDVKPFMVEGTMSEIIPYVVTADGVNVKSRVKNLVMWNDLKVSGEGKTTWTPGIDPEVGW